MIFIAFIFMLLASSMWLLLLISLGCLLCIRSFWEMIYEFYLMHMASKIGASINLKQFGEWGIVTGATDGIGKGYVFALAAKGLNIVLVSRSEKKLKKVIAEVQEKFPCRQFRYIVHDFSSKDDKDVTKFNSSLQDLYPKIGMLVNNVGTGGKELSKPFISLSKPLDEAYDIVQVNINSMLLMTSLVLPELVRRRKGMIINISSFVAVHPMASMATYSGSKAFIDFFSRSIRQETRKSNVLIQTVYPGCVRTNLIPDAFKYRCPTFLTHDFIPFSKQCVDTAGALPETYGCLVHRVQAYLTSALKCLPLRLSDHLVGTFGDGIAAALDYELKKEK